MPAESTHKDARARLEHLLEQAWDLRIHDFVESGKLVAEAMDIAFELDDKKSIADARVIRGYCLMQLDEHDKARNCFKNANRYYMNSGDLRGQAAVHEYVGKLDHDNSDESIEKVETDAVALIEKCVQLSYQGFLSKDKDFNIGYEIIKDDQLKPVIINTKDIEHVFLNLINNAFYTTDKKFRANRQDGYQPHVVISTQQDQDGITISIADNGEGMTEETLQMVFQPFFTTKPTGDGTGLGLSLSYDIVTKGHGGTLKATSSEGMGSEFVVFLPNPS